MIKSTNELIGELLVRKFFLQYKELSEISKELLNSGFGLSSTQLAVALLRKVRSGLLFRKRIDGKWKYIDRQPSKTKTQLKKIQPINYNYHFHHRIREISHIQFNNNDYKGAIQNAFVEVIHQVKIKTGFPKNNEGKDIDGDDLINRVFGCDNQIPKIKFNKLETGLDKAEQRGFMNLFKGIVGIRDKKAHLNFIQNDQNKTIEYLSLASLLVRLLDENPIS